MKNFFLENNNFLEVTLCKISLNNVGDYEGGELLHLDDFFTKDQLSEAFGFAHGYFSLFSLSERFIPDSL